MNIRMNSTIIHHKKSPYRFNYDKTRAIIDTLGGLTTVALAMQINPQTLYRTIRNESRNGRTQQEILRFLGKNPEEVGRYEGGFHFPEDTMRSSAVTSSYR